MNSSKLKSNNLTTNKNQKAIILLYATDKYHKVKQKHIQDCCNQNGIEVIKIITCRCHYDHVMLCDLVETIKSHNEPVDLIVESGSYHAFTQIMTCSVFATLSILEMVDIYAYVEPTVDEKSKLTPVIQDKSAFMLIAEYHYDQLLGAAKHKLPIIAQLYGLK